MDRRTFLAYAAATGLVVWAGNEIPSRFPDLFQVGAVQAAGTDIYPQSVASGDPQSNGITLWTRISPLPGITTIAFQVSTDPNFGSTTLSGVADTDSSKDYTVKVILSDRAELQPATTYYYRFLFGGGKISPTGRFKTLPAPNSNVGRVRFAFISCSDFTNGYFNAMRFLADEDIDFVVHLGDAIYETVLDPSFQRGIRPLTLPSGQPNAQTLEDYRFLYKTYRADPDLQRLHEQFAFISIWDDHEYANDAYRQFNTDSASEAQNNTPSRRQVASQAWAEFTPTSIAWNGSSDPLAAIQLYRAFVFGNLLELVMTDERLYRDGPPCGLATAQRYTTPGCQQLADPQRTMLGSTQRQWFLDKVRNSTRTWKVWGNEVMTMPLKISKAVVDAARLPGLTIPADLYVTLDQWDGYPVERAQIFTALRNANVRNFVTITGDLHTYLAGYQRVNFDAPLVPGSTPSDAVGVEFVVGSISASNFAEQPNPFGVDIATTTALLLAGNPHLQFFNSAVHGYNLIDATPESITCTMKAVSTVTTPGGRLSTLKVYNVARDTVVIRDVTPRA